MLACLVVVFVLGPGIAACSYILMIKILGSIHEHKFQVFVFVTYFSCLTFTLVIDITE